MNVLDLPGKGVTKASPRETHTPLRTSHKSSYAIYRFTDRLTGYLSLPQACWVGDRTINILTN